MYRSLLVENFRGFERLDAPDLRDINLVTGRNSSGKTALLEAFILHAGAVVNPRVPLWLDMWRGLDIRPPTILAGSDSPWDSLFRDFKNSRKIVLDAMLSPGVRSTLELSVLPPGKTPQPSLVRPHFSLPGTTGLGDGDVAVARGLRVVHQRADGRVEATHLIDQSGYVDSDVVAPPEIVVTAFTGASERSSTVQDAERFSQLAVAGSTGEFEDAIRLVQPMVTRIEIVSFGGRPSLHARLGHGRLLPLRLLGEGISRIATILLALLTVSAGSLVLIDEIENGLHYSAYPDLWRSLATTAGRRKVQVVATSHSLECITAAQKMLAGSAVGYQLARISRDERSSRLVEYSPDVLEAALESGLEVR